MSPTIEFQRSDRVLVLAPHPDDETLATGGLVQRALVAECALRVIVATDGDNNPWPQRWLERRWHIDAEARSRWGRRRRAESLVALSILGVPAESVRHLGWVDLGLTDLVLDGAEAEHRLSDEIDAFAPSVIAVPVLFDRHPDHSALRVLLEIAQKQGSRAHCRLIGYLVHGGSLESDSHRLVVDAIQQQTKRRALLAYATQVALSRGRLQRIADREERYDPVAPKPVDTLPASPLRMRISPATRSMFSRRSDLLVVFGIGGTVLRARIVLPHGDGHVQSRIECDAAAVDVVVRVDRTAVDVTLICASRVEWGYIKIERSGRRLFIYDSDGWHTLADCLVDAGITAEVGLSIGRR